MVKDKLTNEVFLMEKEQLLEAIKEVVNDSVKSTNKSQKTYVYGINGLASILGCSRKKYVSCILPLYRNPWILY